MNDPRYAKDPAFRKQVEEKNSEVYSYLMRDYKSEYQNYHSQPNKRKTEQNEI